MLTQFKNQFGFLLLQHKHHNCAMNSIFRSYSSQANIQVDFDIPCSTFYRPKWWLEMKKHHKPSTTNDVQFRHCYHYSNASFGKHKRDLLIDNGTMVAQRHRWIPDDECNFCSFFFVFVMHEWIKIKLQNVHIYEGIDCLVIHLNYVYETSHNLKHTKNLNEHTTVTNIYTVQQIDL